MPGTRSATVGIGHSVCRREAATAGGREASRSHAFDSPWEGECMDARTARPIGEYSPRPFQGCGGFGLVDRMLMKATQLERSQRQAERLSRDRRRWALGALLAARMRQRPEAGRRVEVTPLTRRAGRVQEHEQPGPRRIETALSSDKMVWVCRARVLDARTPRRRRHIGTP